MSVTNDGAPSYICTGREYGVFSLDPRWDGPLRSLEVEFELSAYGGGGADGMSFHLSPAAETRLWAESPDYRPYEALAAGVGLSLTFREREGRGTLALDGDTLAEGAFRGPARDQRVAVRWDAGGLRVRTVRAAWGQLSALSISL